jgi:hypothetical protein
MIRGAVSILFNPVTLTVERFHEGWLRTAEWGANTLYYLTGFGEGEPGRWFYYSSEHDGRDIKFDNMPEEVRLAYLLSQ